MLMVQTSADGIVSDAFIDAVGVTRGLMDWWDVDRSATGVVVSMARMLPAKAVVPTEAEIRAIRAEVTPLMAGTPIEELAEHNRQLLPTLEVVQAHRDVTGKPKE